MEHPAAPVLGVQSMQARVSTLGKSRGGHPTVTLDDGAVWELDDSDSGDPLLAGGDLVTIRRGSLGSFLMETPAKRTHRTHRIQ